MRLDIKKKFSVYSSLLCCLPISMLCMASLNMSLLNMSLTRAWVDLSREHGLTTLGGASVSSNAASLPASS